MKIQILGAGALGSLVGGLLAQHHDVTLIGRKEHVLAVQGSGLRITGLTELHVRPEAVTGPEGLDEPDLLMITVKSYNTKRGARELARLSPEVQIISLQNGLGNINALAGFVPEASIIAGLTSHGATFMEPGHVHHGGDGDTVIGRPFGHNDDFVGELATVLNIAGLETRVSDNIAGEIWVKALVNAAINPLTAIFGVKNGYLVCSQRMRATMLDIIDEGKEVAGAMGVRLPCEDIFEKAIEVATRTSDNKSSMLQDVERRRKTEIASINGALVKMGELHGLRMAANRTVTMMVEDLEAKYLQGGVNTSDASDGHKL